MAQPLYSPDVATCDVFLFPKLKRSMIGWRYATIKEIKTASLEELKTMPKKCLSEVLRGLERHWHEFIISERDYFEGDNIDIDK